MESTRNRSLFRTCPMVTHPNHCGKSSHTHNGIPLCWPQVISCPISPFFGNWTLVMKSLIFFQVAGKKTCKTFACGLRHGESWSVVGKKIKQRNKETERSRDKNEGGRREGEGERGGAGRDPLVSVCSWSSRINFQFCLSLIYFSYL